MDSHKNNGQSLDATSYTKRQVSVLQIAVSEHEHVSKHGFRHVKGISGCVMEAGMKNREMTAHYAI